MYVPTGSIIALKTDSIYLNSIAKEPVFQKREIRSKMASKTLPPGGIRHAPPPVKKGFLTRRVDGSPVRRPKSLAIEPKAASLLPAVVPARIGRQVTQQQQPSRRRYT